LENFQNGHPYFSRRCAEMKVSILNFIQTVILRPYEHISNLSFQKMSFEDYISLARNTANIDFTPANAYKICDLASAISCSALSRHQGL
jgi:hypothetical protein